MIEMTIKEIFDYYIVIISILYVGRLFVLTIEEMEGVGTNIIKELIIFVVLSGISILISINFINSHNTRYQNRLNTYHTYIKATGKILSEGNYLCKLGVLYNKDTINIGTTKYKKYSDITTLYLDINKNTLKCENIKMKYKDYLNLPNNMKE